MLGYWVNPKDFPITVTVAEPVSQGESVAVEVRDRMGWVLIRDDAIERRFTLRAEEIQNMLGAPAAVASPSRG